MMHDMDKVEPQLREDSVKAASSASSRAAGELRALGRVRKISVSMPDVLTAPVRQRVGRGQFSQYVTEAVARQLELDLLNELAALLEAEHGPVPEGFLAQAEAAWPDVETR